VITLDAINAQSGESIAREQVEADSKEQVLSALGKVALTLREKLGESLSSIKNHDVPIEQATTSSLEALKAYATGNEARAKGKNDEEITFYKRAIELDQNFAMAYARTAVYYGNRDEIEKAQPYAQKAFDLRDRVSERERLYISEKYYSYVLGDADKVLEVLQTWSRLYPNDYIPRNNLALRYQQFGRYEDALKEALEAVRLSPNNTAARDNLIGSLMALDRVDEAREALEQLRKLYPEGPAVHFSDYNLAFMRGDVATMEREAKWAEGKAVEADFLRLQAAAAAALGQMKKAEGLRKRAIDELKRKDRLDNAAQTLIGLASRQAAYGNCDYAKDNVVTALKLHRGKFTLTGAAMVYADCADPTQALNLLSEGLKAYPTDTILGNVFAPLIRLQVERARGNPEEALKLADSVRRYDFGSFVGPYTNYVRGLTYLDLKKGPEAAAEFQKIIDRRGVDPMSELRPLAHVGLARAAAMSGDVAKARTSYQNFFALWKDADADLPILIQAKKEYEQLK